MNSGLDSTELALLAHELRGALTVILGLTDLLRTELSPPAQVSALEGIDRAVSRADALVASALRGEAPSSGDVKELVDLAALVAEVVDEQRGITGRTVTLDSLGAPVVTGDGYALGRALGNLVDNALKYSLANSPVEVRVFGEASSAVIEVADRGPGIPEDQSDAVFEPFERLGRDGAVPGSGLGLTVVRNVAQAHAGTVTVMPREGGGTVVRLVLPLAEV